MAYLLTCCYIDLVIESTPMIENPVLDRSVTLFQMDYNCQFDYFPDKITNVFECRNPGADDLKEAQRADSTLKLIIELLKNNEAPNFKDERLRPYRSVWRKLVVDDEILLKRSEGEAVVVVPESKVNEILGHIHGNLFASHYGISKSYFKIRKKFYFVNMIARLTDFIESCTACQKRKMPKNPPKPELYPIEVDTRDIGGVISYDFKGPLPPSRKSALYQTNNRYVLVIIDHATKFAHAVATPTMEASLVADIILSQWIPRFGVPRVVISDRARSFTGKIMSTIYKALQVEMCLTASYNPNCNGLVEQMNRSISSLLMILIEDDVSEWPKKLPMVFSAYNASIQSTTGYSPNYLVYARDLIEPIDLILRKDGISGEKQTRTFMELEDRLALRRRALELLQLKQNQRNDKVREETLNKAKVDRFEIGDIVGFRAPPKPNKLFKSYEIHHKVVKILSPVTYIIKNTKTGFERTVNVRKLRRLKVRKGEIIPCETNDPGCSESSQSDENDDEEPRVEVTQKDAMEESVTCDQEATEKREETRSARSTEKDVSSGTEIVVEWSRRLRKRDLLKKPDRLGC